MEIVLPNIAVDVAIALAIVAVIVLLILARPRRKERRVLSLAQVQDGLYRTGIVTMEGRKAGSGLFFYIRNRSSALVQLQSEPATLIEATDPQRQNLIIPRLLSRDIPAKTTQKVEVDALSLAARKLPPGPRGEGGYRVGGLTEDDEILNLLGAVERLEAEIARHVRQIDGDRVTYKPMADDLTILATCCTCAELESGGCQVQVSGEVIQYALWQLTDKLSFEALVDQAAQPPSPEGRAKMIIKTLAANILLEGAGLEPTAEI